MGEGTEDLGGLPELPALAKPKQRAFRGARLGICAGLVAGLATFFLSGDWACTAMGMAFAFSIIVGILAGLFPAFKAARLNPIQALRYE